MDSEAAANGGDPTERHVPGPEAPFVVGERLLNARHEHGVDVDMFGDGARELLRCRAARIAAIDAAS